MKIETIDTTINDYINSNDIPGCSLIVRKDDKIVYQNKWGYADIDSKKEITYDSIFRIMSMTKCTISIAIMQLVERGLLSIDDPLSKFIPEFENMRVVSDSKYEYKEGMSMLSLLPKLMLFKQSNVKSIPAIKQITIRDLLSHSSGIEQGVFGLLAMTKNKRFEVNSLQSQVDKYSKYLLDFEPGTGTGYSPLAGFDLLARVIEIVSGQSIDDYLQCNVFNPLKMINTTFKLSASQNKNLVLLYKKKNNTLINVTDTKDDIEGIIKRGKNFCSGSGGLYSTLTDYENLARMLCNNGNFDGHQFLKPETVQMIHTEAPIKHLETEPGFVWGLGVKIRQDPSKSMCFATKETYGWSGAFGTHFFVSPNDNLDCVFMINRSDLDGAGSFISNKIEELVFGIFSNTKDQENQDGE